MSYRIVPRAEIGLPSQVTNMSGSPRNALSKGREGLTVHYVGAGKFRDRDPKEAVLAIESFARSPQKATPFEYNFMIHQRDDDLVYEYAGFFQAADSARNNTNFFGVCLLNGVGEKPTEPQIDKVRWLRHRLVADGWIRQDGQLLPHQRMPGQVGATTCPGTDIMARWDDLDRPWSGGAPVAVDMPAASTDVPAPDGNGHHLVRENDTNATIAALHIGSAERAGDVEGANDGRTPETGQRWTVPGIDGAWVAVEAGWGAFSCIRAAGFSPSAAAVTCFWSWNGGDPGAGERGPLIAGELVWVENLDPQAR